MKEFFIVANSFAAPFFSDTSETFQKGSSAADALQKFAVTYKHPCGLYAATCYEDANAYHKNAKPLAKWLSNQARILQEKKGTSFYSEGPGRIRIDGEWVDIGDPKQGRLVDVA